MFLYSINILAESYDFNISEKFFLYHWDSLSLENIILSNTRFDFTEKYSENFNFNAAYEISPYFGNQISDSLFNMKNLNYRVYDVSSSDFGNFHINHNIDRLLATFYLGFSDVTVGRQAISFGSARCVNPTDVISALNQTSLDKEYRSGVDGLKFVFPIGDLSQLETGLLFNSKFKDYSAFIRTKMNFLEFDLSFIFIKYQLNFLFGIDIEKSILDFMWWFEGAYSWLDRKSDNDIGNMVRFSSGLDRTFSEKFYAFIEYHYNGAGFDVPAQYYQASFRNAYISSRVFLLSKHYIIPGLSWAISPLFSLSAILFTNLLDHSFFFSPTISYNFSKNWFFDFIIIYGVGETPTKTPQNDIIYNSEFGAYGKLLALSLRWYI